MRIPLECNDHSHRRVAPPPSSSFHHAKTAAACFGVSAWNQSLSEYGVKRGACTGPLMSTRWSPTPEQLQSLEDMYRHGVRTPSAEQIQQIVAKLRRFGRIEGKNVFYWFQNHKAREKQRKRRRLEMLAAKKMQDFETIEKQSQSGTRKCYGVHHSTRSSTSASSNCNTYWKYSSEAASMDGWTQLELSSCIFTNNSTAQKVNNGYENGMSLLGNTENGSFIRTLELFPVRTPGFQDGGKEEEEEEEDYGNGVSRIVTPVPNQFFEFLPTREI